MNAPSGGQLRRLLKIADEREREAFALGDREDSDERSQSEIDALEGELASDVLALRATVAHVVDVHGLCPTCLGARYTGAFVKCTTCNGSGNR